jgi:hypothetical protein
MADLLEEEAVQCCNQKQANEVDSSTCYNQAECVIVI